MRALTKNERVLLLAMGAAVFVIANLVLVRWVSEQLQSTRRELERAAVEIRTLKAVLQEKPYWEARQKWMMGSPPDEYFPGQTDLDFAEQVRRSIDGAGLKVAKLELGQTVADSDLAVVVLDIDVVGELKPIVEWLQVLQQPAGYVNIDRFSLKRAGADSNMNLSLRVKKVFSDPTKIAEAEPK